MPLFWQVLLGPYIAPDALICGLITTVSFISIIVPGVLKTVEMTRFAALGGGALALKGGQLRVGFFV